ncbi:unnamed protein product, partial [Oncorhynchus mykiss]
MFTTEAVIKAKNYDKVEKLFQRCLMKVLHIDLWKCYLSYVRETKGKLPSYKEKMAQAYDFALDKIGMEIMSYQIWVDYINFLKGVEAVGSYAENQRITAVRRVYQRGCVNPMINIEQLWRDYSKYEEGINVHLAKKMIEDRSRDYMNARRVAKEYETVMKGLDRNAPSVPPQNSPQEAVQVEMWKKYIQWEKSNPLRTEDQTLITKRVAFKIFELGLKKYGDIPEYILAYIDYLSHLNVTDSFIETCHSPSCVTITQPRVAAMATVTEIVYDGIEDYRGSNIIKLDQTQAEAVYRRRCVFLYFIGVYILNKNINNIQDFSQVKFIYIALRTSADISKCCTETQPKTPNSKQCRCRSTVARKNSLERPKPRKKPREEPGYVGWPALIYRFYMTGNTDMHLLVTDRLKTKGGGVDQKTSPYLVPHLFLYRPPEDNNTRVLFERVLTSGSLSPEKSGEIWARFLAFESNIGDLASILKVERRRFTAFKDEYEGKETALLVDRYKFMDLYPCSASELKALGYKDVSRAKLAALLQTETVVTPSAPTQKDEADRKPEYPKPDTSQMIPYQPRHLAPPGLHPVPGGVFPVPPAAVILMKLLPPPTCFV